MPMRMVKKKSFKETVMYCCACICQNCVQIRKPFVESKIAESIEVRFDDFDKKR